MLRPRFSCTSLLTRSYRSSYRRLLALLILLGAPVGTSLTLGAEPGWTDSAIKRSDDRASDRETPITERPYRPLHVYGNTVRRVNYRGRALPSAQDAANTVRALRSARP
jgi:hypothetical protein